MTLETKDLIRFTPALREEAEKLKSADHRQIFANSSRSPFETLGNTLPLWEWILQAWHAISSQSSFAPGSEETDFLGALAAFSRNLVAGNEDSQTKMLSISNALHNLLFSMSSYEVLSNENCLPTTRALVQLLANMIAGNAVVSSAIFPQLVKPPFDGNVLIRLLASDDDRLGFALTMVLTNATDVYPAGTKLLITRNDHSCGLSIIERLLRRIEDWFESDVDGLAFNNGYEIICQIIQAGHLSTLYIALQHPSKEEPISAAQLTILKLLDAYIQSSRSSYRTYVPASLQFLIPTTTTLINLVRELMDSAVSAETDRPEKNEKKEKRFSDVRFGKSYEGLILCLEIINQLGAKSQPTNNADDETEGEVERREELVKFVNELRVAEFDEKSIVMLGLSDKLEPRLIRTQSSADVPSASITPLDGSTEDEEGLKQDTRQHFASLRKCLVRILNLLSYNNKEGQDRIRTLGGLEVILGLCALDETNPYLREHALFTLRGLLLDNAENQALVKELEPMGVVGQDGEVGPVPDRWKK
ncbi:Uncharacterized conserved protein [Phaffia rhodozyma]|uniref:Ataxin-10 homolog n=1 Tax=Phaffia rhodozyma TaxID=264483 RepID=A0A0F7SNS9_PHARH|nr:Uncharacterized conserved protein [Phaffia rhodozyma]